MRDAENHGKEGFIFIYYIIYIDIDIIVDEVGHLIVY